MIKYRNFNKKYLNMLNLVVEPSIYIDSKCVSGISNANSEQWLDVENGECYNILSRWHDMWE